jgi:hypothetical protein
VPACLCDKNWLRDRGKAAAQMLGSHTRNSIVMSRRRQRGAVEQWAREELNLRPHAYQAREADAGARVPVRRHRVTTAQRGLAPARNALVVSAVVSESSGLLSRSEPRTLCGALSLWRSMWSAPMAPTSDGRGKLQSHVRRLRRRWVVGDSRDNRSLGTSDPAVANPGLVRPPFVYLGSITLFVRLGRKPRGTR